MATSDDKPAPVSAWQPNNATVQLMADASFLLGYLSARDDNTPEVEQRIKRAWEVINRLSPLTAPPVSSDTGAK